MDKYFLKFTNQFGKKLEVEVYPSAELSNVLQQFQRRGIPYQFLKGEIVMEELVVIRRDAHEAIMRELRGETDGIELGR